MAENDANQLSAEEVAKVREIIKREKFSEEAQKKLMTGAVSFSKFVIESGKVLATIAMGIALVKGWASDFVISIMTGGKK